MDIESDTERKFTRIHFDRKVNLEFVSNSYDHCRIKNLSLTGMFVIGDFQQQADKYCLIHLVQAEMSTDLSLQASAKVVRKDVEGIVIEFTSMPFDSYMFLQTTLLYEANGAMAILNEFPDNSPFEITDELPVQTSTK